MARPNTEDMLAIQDLLARYNWHFDTGEGQAWAALWTADGTFRNGDVVATGSEALSALAIGSYDMFSGGIRHHTTDIMAEYGPSNAIINARACVLTTNWAEGGKLFGLILADLVFERTLGGWRLKSNTVTMKRA